MSFMQESLNIGRLIRNLKAAQVQYEVARTKSELCHKIKERIISRFLKLETIRFKARDKVHDCERKLYEAIKRGI